MKTTIYAILFAAFIIIAGLTVPTNNVAAKNTISSNSLVMEASNSNFCQGFYAGFRAGFCYNRGYGCIAPPPPICPIPNMNENWNSYRDGYNRGFLVGFNQ